MHSILKSLAALISIAIVGILTSCGSGQALIPGSPLDTAETQYRRGMLALDEGDLWTAQAQFERARALDEDFPGYHVGAALVASFWGDHFQARQHIDRALHQDNDFVDAHIALGRVVAGEGQALGLEPGKWLPQARKSFNRAAHLAPDQPEPHFHHARAELAGGELAKAVGAYQRIVELNRGPLVERALAEIERIQSIQRAAPGTRVGAQIAAREAVTRAELAVLLLEELGLEELIEQRRPNQAAQSFQPPGEQLSAATPSAQEELRTAWARPWIDRVLALGVPGFELLPDGTFHGDDPVTRSQYARVIEGILTLLVGDPNLAIRYVGEPSRFPDMQSDHFAYNAIALCVDRGIMAPDRITGRFRPEDPVSGAEALVIVRDLQNAVRMEF